ncbi:DUF1345 domain-containing protein [Rhodoferax saidenbachensis]|uniref:Membrane protein n=1 Tax=Rhodoferax saidenbachensis TaxID=1484693 RepID=A0ABU1ZRF8_9BURK|nr:DUF1345 domain-containing protein [Rhodoferax saidenbachensis]MDR7307968.1 putative membrane protein [Rhodoferax saidenbachensis]
MRKHFSETTGHQRLVYGAIAGGLMAVLPLPIGAPSRALLAWTVGASAYLVLSWWLAVEFDAQRTRARAQAQDQPGMMLFALLLLSVFASFAAIALMLLHVKDLSGAQRAAHLGLSMLALASTWLLMQTIFAFRYAHVYYQEELRGHPRGAGLEFPGKLPPDYFDFMYYAHVVGMTSQVSDVVVTARHMRRLTLMHSVSAFGFNMLVLALSINVMAGAIQ